METKIGLTTKKTKKNFNLSQPIEYFEERTQVEFALFLKNGAALVGIKIYNLYNKQFLRKLFIKGKILRANFPSFVIVRLHSPQ